MNYLNEDCVKISLCGNYKCIIIRTKLEEVLFYLKLFEILKNYYSSDIVINPFTGELGTLNISIHFTLSYS